MHGDPDDDAASHVIATKLSPVQQAQFNAMAERGTHEYIVELEQRIAELTAQVEEAHAVLTKADVGGFNESVPWRISVLTDIEIPTLRAQRDALTAQLGTTTQLTPAQVGEKAQRAADEIWAKLNMFASYSDTEHADKKGKKIIAALIQAEFEAPGEEDDHSHSDSPYLSREGDR